MHLVHWYISVFHGSFALVLCTSIRPASLLCRKPRLELSGSQGEIPLTFPLLYKSVVRGVVGVVGRVASHRQSNDILAPLFAGVSPFSKRHFLLLFFFFFTSFLFVTFFFLLLSLFPHPPTHPVVGDLYCFLFVTFSCFYMCFWHSWLHFRTGKTWGLPYLMTSSQRLSLHVVSFLPCSFSLCHSHDHSIGVGGRGINRLLVTVIYWFLAFYVALWLFGGTWSFPPGEGALARGWLPRPSPLTQSRACGEVGIVSA